MYKQAVSTVKQEHQPCYSPRTTKIDEVNRQRLYFRRAQTRIASPNFAATQRARRLLEVVFFLSFSSFFWSLESVFQVLENGTRVAGRGFNFRM